MSFDSKKLEAFSLKSFSHLNDGSNRFIDPLSVVPYEFFESSEYVRFLVELIDSQDETDNDLASRLVLNFSLPAGACAEDREKIQNALGKAIRISLS